MKREGPNWSVETEPPHLMDGACNPFGSREYESLGQKLKLTALPLTKAESPFNERGSFDSRINLIWVWNLNLDAQTFSINTSKWLEESNFILILEAIATTKRPAVA